MALKLAPRRTIAYLALVLGVIGSAIAVAAALVVLWLGATAADVVEDTVSTIVAAVDRLDSRLAETSSGVQEADRAGELRVRAQRVGDVARHAVESLGAIDDHPLFGRLPVDTTPLSAILERLEDASRALNEDLAGAVRDEPVPARLKATITERLTAAQDQLATGNDKINDIQNQLRLWIRLSAFAGFLLCLWGLWAQVALARRGWRTRAASLGAS